MKIGNDYRIESADRESSMQYTADRLGLDRRAVAERAADLAESIPCALDSALASLPPEMAEHKEIQVLGKMMGARARKCRSIAGKAIK